MKIEFEKTLGTRKFNKQVSEPLFLNELNSSKSSIIRSVEHLSCHFHRVFPKKLKFSLVQAELFPIQAIAWAPNDKRIAYCDDDRCIWIYDENLEYLIHFPTKPVEKEVSVPSDTFSFRLSRNICKTFLGFSLVWEEQLCGDCHRLCTGLRQTGRGTKRCRNLCLSLAKGKVWGLRFLFFSEISVRNS
jgi:hypothetical protein